MNPKIKQIYGWALGMKTGLKAIRFRHGNKLKIQICHTGFSLTDQLSNPPVTIEIPPKSLASFTLEEQ